MVDTLIDLGGNLNNFHYRFINRNQVVIMNYWKPLKNLVQLWINLFLILKVLF